MGAEDVTVFDGRVEFTGDWEMAARANLWLRTAERVQILLGSFRAVTFTQLFDQVERLPLEEFIGKKDAFPVKGWSLNSQLHSVPDCQSIIKKAAVKRLSRVYGVNWFEETGPVHQLQFSILKDQVTVLLDLSGAGLHKRGYRRISNLAPIKETLAAGILDLARIYPDTRLYDPFCGSGTILIEGAYKARNIAPGLYRRFAAEKWECIPAQVWRLSLIHIFLFGEREGGDTCGADKTDPKLSGGSAGAVGGDGGGQGAGSAVQNSPGQPAGRCGDGLLYVRL